MGHGHAHGMTDEARERWRARQIRQDLHRDARREWEKTLPDIPWDSRRRVKGEVVDESGPPPEIVVDVEPARLWDEAKDGKVPTSARSLAKAAEKVGYATQFTHSHQERRGGVNNRLLDPPEADVCAVQGARGSGERFIADWELVAPKDGQGEAKWKVRDALVWSPEMETYPRIVKVSTLKKEYLR